MNSFLCLPFNRLYWQSEEIHTEIHCPVKNVTGILMEILFHVTSRHKSTGIWSNLTPMPWLFHVIYPGFICFLCWNMTWILDMFKSWNVHDPWHLLRKWWNFPCGFGLVIDQTPSKIHEEILDTFYTGAFCFSFFDGFFSKFWIEFDGIFMFFQWTRLRIDKN